jgi:hypothetical protein
MHHEAAAKAAALPVATVAESPSSSMLLPLVLGIALGLLLMIVGVALKPAWAMRRSAAVVVEDRRETLLYGGVAVALAIGVGVGVALVLS